jgi:recombination protein RecA
MGTRLQPTNHGSRLSELLAEIRARWGRDAIAPLAQQSPPMALATAFANLDDLLGIGGLPRGKLVEFCGLGTSGAQTLALHITALVQGRNENVAYLDVAHTLDAAMALGCGVAVEALVRVCPTDGEQALNIAYTLLDRAAVDLLIIDSLPILLRQKNGAQLLASALPQLLHPMARSQAVVILLSDPGASARVTTHAAVRLGVERRDWMVRFDDTIGYQIVLTVLKNSFGRSGQQTTLDLIFNQHDDDTL